MTTSGPITRGGLHPSREQNFVEHDLPRLLSAAKARRLATYDKANVELFVADASIRTEPDGRTAAPCRVWRTVSDGRIFDELPRLREPSNGPDAVAIVLGDSESDVAFIELRAIDADIYQLECGRHRAIVERDEAERAAHDAAVEAARRNAPRSVCVGPVTMGLAELLDRLERTAGELRIVDDRVHVLLPVGSQIIGNEADYTRAVEHLRPLLVATQLGTVPVGCDLHDCDGHADQIAAGGAWLCAQHGR